MRPLLEEQNRASLSGTSLGYDDVARRLDEGRVLAAVDEAGQVTVVLVGPARGLLGERGDPSRAAIALRPVSKITS